MNVSSTLNPLGSTSATATGTGSPSKIHAAAQQFEAMMIGEMLKSTRESSSWGLSDEEDADPGQDSLSGMSESQFALALAKGGGLGLTQMVEQGVSKQAGSQKENTAPRTDSAASLK